MARRVLRPTQSKLYREAAKVDSYIDNSLHILWLLLTSRQVNPLVILLRRLLGACVIASLIVYGFKPVLVQAELSTFYPSSCLGGWKTPEAAQGEPESGDSGDLAASSSALLPANTIADLYCGSFRGKIPEDTVPKSAKLKLVWWYADDMPESSTLTTENIASSTDDILNSEASTSIQFIPQEEASTTEESASSSEQSLIPYQKFLTLVGIQKAYAQESSEGETAAPASSNVEEVAAPVVSDSPTTGEENSDSVATSTKEDETTSTSTAQSTSTDGAEEIAAQVSNEPSDALFEVFYTLDGTTWRSLGTVKSTALHEAVFDIPLGDGEGDAWNTIASLQVNIKRLQTLNDVRPVLLDGMVLEIEHTISEKKEEVKSDSKRLEANALVEGETTKLVVKEDSDQGQILSIHGTSNETLVLYNGTTRQVALTIPLSDDVTDIPVYQLEAVGHYVGVITKRADACYLMDLVECGRDKQAVDTLSFDIAPTANTPLEYRPANTVPVGGN